MTKAGDPSKRLWHRQSSRRHAWSASRAAAKGINKGINQGNQNAPAQKVNDWFGGEPDSGLF
jgi:hypothetical protein